MSIIRRKNNSPAPVSTGSNSVTVRIGESIITMQPGQETSSHNDGSEVDIVAVFDTTGSMEGNINGLIKSMKEFTAALEHEKLNWRFSTVPFGDLLIQGDRVVTTMPWVKDVPRAQAQLQGMPRFNGGGNFGESSLEAMHGALSRNFRPTALRVIVLITDDTPHLKKHSVQSITRDLVRNDVLCFVVAQHENVYLPFAQETGGTSTRISSEVDASRFISLFRKVATDISKRTVAVKSLANGSPQRLIEIERGRG
jgi:hypothetical protein